MSSQHDITTIIRSDHLGRVHGKEVEAVTDLSRSTIARRVKEGTFPPPIPGLTRRLWMKEDILTYLASTGRRTWQPWVPGLRQA